MKEKINRLAKGIIDSEVPQIICSPYTIDDVVRAGEITKKEIYITSENNLHIKGLMYSSSERVCIQNYAFGGLRNHITYEINSGHLEHGDIIKGSFYLVTNGGEKEIPYSFRVELGNSGKVLGGLETAADFGKLAKNDWDTALRLFEYQDFIEAPFMQDIGIRAVYDGLKGRVNRHNQMEEFLVFLKVKDPVRLEIPEETRFYENLLEPLDDKILIKKNTWGYAYMEAKADGDFILLPQKIITNADFTDNQCEFKFRIQPSRLHKGRNFGAVILTMYNKTVTIPVEALGDETVEVSDGTAAVARKDLERYISLRLDYESGTYEDAFILNQMIQKLELVRALYEPNNRLNLMYAELLFLTDNKEQACLILDESRESILMSRLEEVEDYCYYQYLNLLIHPNDGQKESLIRLLNKYLEERKQNHYLFFLLLKLDEDLAENPANLLARIKKIYARGCHSPLLYAKVCKILNGNPEFLKNLEGMELQALNYGVKKDVISSDLALKTAKTANAVKYFNKILYHILAKLYEKYPEKEILGALCGILIKGGIRTADAFTWYEKALAEKVSLTRLYEYYLYSLPKDYNHALPREILLYFSYDNELDRYNKSVLYQNILTYVNADTAIYKDYEREIEQFAMNQLFAAQINRRLAVIYDHMIYKDMIDKPVAKVLPAILRSYRISCRNQAMKYVVVCHEELLEEEAYIINDGVAYVPLFSEKSHILFQDAYGNRYADIAYVKTPVMDKPELEQRCFEVYPEHTMLLLKECGKILELENPDEGQIRLLEQLAGQLKLHPMYEKKILSKIVSYYARMAAGEEEDTAEKSSSYLLMMDMKSVTRAERISVCETFIRQGYIREAYELIKEYGAEKISDKHLLKMCSKMILQSLFDQDDLLLHLSYRVFDAGFSDSVVMDYLCEHYNGTASQMYRVLKQGLLDHVETYDLEERLLAQMLFSDAMLNIDKVFDLYASRKKTSESIVKAYFTVKSAEYFIQGLPSDDKVFSYLEGAIHGTIEKDKVPTIYLLALTKYYSTLPKLTDEQKKLCETIMNIILSEGMVFAYFKDLAKHMAIPEDIMDKGIIQYCGRKDSKVELKIRILPDEEEFHAEEMKRVYQGIFIKQKILFEGEIMEYQIYDLKDGTRVLAKEGSISCDMSAFPKSDSRFACLNDMGLCLSLKEEESLKKKMQEYLVKIATAEELFSLM